MKTFKKILIWIVGLLILYIGVCIIIFFLQEKISFISKRLTSDHQLQFDNKFEELMIPANDGIKLNGALFKADTSNGLIFFLHGSGGNIERYRKSVPKYLSLNYDVFLLDYRGYGKSEGKIKNEKQFFEDVRTAYSFMKTKYKEDNIVIIGFSLGTTLSSMLASENKPRLLVLEGPGYSLIERSKSKLPYLPVSLISKYKFENYMYLKNVKVPVIIYFGSNDDLSGDVRLKQCLKVGDKFIMLEGEGHNDFALNNQYINELSELLK